MKILIVGLGSIGRRHLQNLNRVAPDAEVAVWRQRALPAKPDEAGRADRFLHSEGEALAFDPDAAIIASPASLHVANALALARRGVPLLIEKPLADSLAGADQLLAACQEAGSILMVGYNLRFYEPLQRVREAVGRGDVGRIVAARFEVGQYLPDWRPGQDYRQTASARRELGGGVVLELSHEIDYARWLVGEMASVFALTGKLSDLEIDVEDTAEIMVEFSNGAVGSIHLDMVARVATRSCRIVGTAGTVEWALGNRARLYRAEAAGWCDLHADTAALGDTYIGELRHFLDCVEKGGEPAVSARDGRRVLEIVEAVKQSASGRRSVEL